MSFPQAVPRWPHLRRKGALLGAGIAVPASIMAFGSAISEALGRPDPSYVYGSYDLMPLWLAIGAIVAAPALGWFLAPYVKPQRAGFQWSLAIGYAVLCDVVVAVIVGALLASDSVSGGDWLRAAQDFGTSWLTDTLFGIFLYSLPALVLLLPCASLWVLLMRRGSSRSSDEGRTVATTGWRS